jgi:hypothetical protein
MGSFLWSRCGSANDTANELSLTPSTLIRGRQLAGLFHTPRPLNEGRKSHQEIRFPGGFAVVCFFNNQPSVLGVFSGPRDRQELFDAFSQENRAF